MSDTPKKTLRFINTAESTPWRDAFPEYSETEMPGVCLAGARHRENLTQARLSELTGIPQRHISEMENAKRPIGKRNAKVLAKAMNTNYMNFMANMLGQTLKVWKPLFSTNTTKAILDLF